MVNPDFWHNKKIAVPGGGGFLGSRIVARLQNAGAHVFVPRTSEGWDFRDLAACQKFFAETKPEFVFNCAAMQGGIGYHKGREAELFMDNMRMGLFLMQAAQEAGVKKFINVVAGCSYPGYTEKEELIEDEYWDGAVHESIFSYGFSRKASVGYGAALYRQYSFNSIHLIMANMYGPGEHFNPEQSKALAGLMKKTYDAKQSGKSEIEIWGTGKPVRDWLYVEDGADGIIRAAQVYNNVEPLNIATGVGISVNDLAVTIQKVSGWSGSFSRNTSKPDGAMRKLFSVKKMERELSWLPQTSLEEGITQTWKWFEENYDQAVKY